MFSPTISSKSPAVWTPGSGILSSATGATSNNPTTHNSNTTCFCWFRSKFRLLWNLSTPSGHKGFLSKWRSDVVALCTYFYFWVSCD
ncbi:hypothetical protein FGIG_12371 [Fasciola gigantica]|uniref:Uncharacterized protein n=1 Tax=Fasciola gigantica TaxID=46835 RepID=A0A504YDF4_FASGI|nr:hypothetical protein FGIG_12371 [Fasciola gigantica]